MDKQLNFTLIGRSGCGKGTQAKLLMKEFGDFCCVSSGDLFRDLSKADTDTSIRVAKIVKSGGFPPDDLAITLWMHELAYNLRENQGILADGFPRRLNEAEALDRFLEFLERKENTFNLLIDISREEALGRLTKRRICKDCGRLIPWVGEFKELKNCDKCGGELITRNDDIPEAINNRLDFYDETMVKVVEYYEQQGSLIRVNGEQSIDDVFKEILEKIQ
jgi:adenylate kinase